MSVILALKGKFRYNFIVATLLSNAPGAANNNDNHNNKEDFFQNL
jgi:hypothetical protein